MLNPALSREISRLGKELITKQINKGDELDLKTFSVNEDLLNNPQEKVTFYEVCDVRQIVWSDADDFFLDPLLNESFGTTDPLPTMISGPESIKKDVLKRAFSFFGRKWCINTLSMVWQKALDLITDN